MSALQEASSPGTRQLDEPHRPPRRVAPGVRAEFGGCEAVAESDAHLSAVPGPHGQRQRRRPTGHPRVPVPDGVEALELHCRAAEQFARSRHRQFRFVCLCLTALSAQYIKGGPDKQQHNKTC